MSTQITNHIKSTASRHPWPTLRKPLEKFKTQDPPRSWFWHASDDRFFTHALEKLDDLKRSKRDLPRIWRRAYGLSWNLFGHSFEIAARQFLLRERLKEIRKVHPLANFYPGHALGFARGKNDEAVPDGLSATLDLRTHSLLIHEIYELKSQTRLSLDEVEEQIERTRRNIELRKVLILKLLEKDISLHAQFSKNAPYSLRQAAIVLPDFSAVSQTEQHGIPIFSVPFDAIRVRELVVDLIWSHLDLNPNQGGTHALISA